MTSAAAQIAELEHRYRCPKCKRRVTVLLENVAVSCSRCGRVMKCVESVRAERVHTA